MEPARLWPWVPLAMGAFHPAWATGAALDAHTHPTGTQLLLAPSRLLGPYLVLALGSPPSVGIMRMFRGEPGIGGTQGFNWLSQIKFHRAASGVLYREPVTAVSGLGFTSSSSDTEL